MLGQILCLERLASVSHQTENALIWSHTEPRHPNLKNQSQSPISSHSHTLGNKFAFDGNQKCQEAVGQADCTSPP